MSKEYIKITHETFNQLDHKIYWKEFKTHVNHQKMFTSIKEQEPDLYKKIYESLNTEEREWLKNNRLSRDYIDETFRTKNNSCDRLLKNGEREDGTFTAISIMNNEIHEKITQIQLSNIFGQQVQQNNKATHHSRDGYNYANCNPDFVCIMPDGTKVFIELQVSFRRTNKLEEMNMKKAKITNYKKQIENNNYTVIHCEKNYDLTTGKSTFYMFDTTKLINKKGILVTDENLHEHIDTTNKIPIYNKYASCFISGGRHPKLFFENLQDCGIKVGENQRVDITQYIQSHDKYYQEYLQKKDRKIEARERKQKPLGTSMGELLKKIGMMPEEKQEKNLDDIINNAQTRIVVTTRKTNERNKEECYQLLS